MSQRKFVLDDNAFDAICSFVRSANPDCNHSMLAVIEIFSAIVVVMHTARARNDTQETWQMLQFSWLAHREGWPLLYASRLCG
jgi:hypothetical protein